MSLRSSFAKAAKKFVTGLVILSTVFLAACGYPTHHLGTEQGLQGQTQMEEVYTDAAPQPVLIVQGSQLRPENHYVYNGSLRIEGDVPAHTEVEVTNGKLQITGNVGDESAIETRLPVNTHQETHIVLIPIMHSTGKSFYTTLMPVPQTSTIEDGLTHPADTGPAVTIDGQAGNKVEVTTNGGIRAGGWGTEFRAKTGYGRQLEQTPAPAARTAQARPAAPGS